ncbi:Lysine-specific demethylase 8 [Capsicum baccatum]|uniref:Lysine-specific demethylase 8 n=1 Tax=Capsicum baccatum TaxID=33114 RepID=A0A2G2X2G0_CAPBA|nr:Lysine-specific demethylase 8 [Capsicum baccatum]
MALSLVNWVKYITDRESRGNSGPSSVAFCIRNSYGAFVVAKGFKLHDTTNIVAEARSVKEGFSWRESISGQKEIKVEICWSTIVALLLSTIVAHISTIVDDEDIFNFVFSTSVAAFTHEGKTFEVGNNYLRPEWKQELITFVEFLKRIRSNDTTSMETMYLAQHQLFDQIQELRQDVVIPDYCFTGGGEIRSLNAWFCPAGIVTPLHHEPHHNILAQWTYHFLQVKLRVKLVRFCTFGVKFEVDCKLKLKTFVMHAEFLESLDQLPGCFTITDPYISGNPIVHASWGFLEMFGYSKYEKDMRLIHLLGFQVSILRRPKTSRVGLNLCQDGAGCRESVLRCYRRGVYSMSMERELPVTLGSSLEFIGFSKDEVLGYNCRSLSMINTDSSSQFWMKECIQNEQQHTVHMYYRKDETSFWLNISPVRNASGKTGLVSDYDLLALDSVSSTGGSDANMLKSSS